ncbi:hypothetical protein BDN71DRAFT_1436910, partial [Pleurotus eryngii]
NFMKEKKQYYAITSGAQVGVVKGVVSGGVCLGFCLEALAVEHFQKGVSSRTVIVRKPLASPISKCRPISENVGLHQMSDVDMPATYQLKVSACFGKCRPVPDV